MAYKNQRGHVTDDGVRNKIPRWLQEVLARGYSPIKNYDVFRKNLFSYIGKNSRQIKSFPNKFIFTVEGIPGSGKTSIADGLKRDSLIQTVPQILPAEPKFDQAEKQSFYFKSDALKTKTALSCEPNLVFMDRYYPSTLGFYWAFDFVHNTRTYQKALSWYEKRIEDGGLIRPFRTFLVETPITIGAERKRRRIGNDLKNLWLNKRFLSAFSDYYKYFYGTVEKNTVVIKLSGKQPLAMLQDRIQSQIHEISKKI